MRIESVKRGTSVFENAVKVEFEDLGSSTYDWIYLRDNCPCSECQHVQTKQRVFDIFNTLSNKPGKDLETSLKRVEQYLADSDFQIMNSKLVCNWSDSHISEFDEKWLLQHSYEPKLTSKSRKIIPNIRTWGSHEFWQLNSDGTGVNSYDRLTHELPQIFEQIHVNGFAFIQNVPVTLESTERVSAAISIIRPTHYDPCVWDFTSDLAKNDTAYTSLAIDMHVDGTYWNEPPGYQLFHLLEHTNGEGGDTRIVDVAKILEILVIKAAADRSWQKTLQVLSEQPLVFHQSGDSNQEFEQDSFPTLTLAKDGSLVQCRWNTSDRAAFIEPLPRFTVADIYQALFRFNALINNPDNYVQFKMEPGKIFVFDNWRVLHARTAFTGYRRLCGSYLTRDDFMARFKSCYPNSHDA
ncbi:LAMI_0E06238g1_1 [Lachancea mirantina]|uniref:trimethyllysine dioxygenase n=1 Tax=Lachancea mirantina TaxID=1230905 RepID=A0A1G4JLR4_9SACH|nr:LAMI_0E06238g1_1 [Lachancea mirantina]